MGGFFRMLISIPNGKINSKLVLGGINNQKLIPGEKGAQIAMVVRMSLNYHEELVMISNSLHDLVP